MVKLPTLSWFMGMLAFRGDGNIYSGSAGCDPNLGNVDSKTFRYRVWIEKNDEGYYLKAVHYIGLYSYDATEKDIMSESTFEATENGIAEAQKWLQTAQDEAVAKFTNNN